LPGAALGEGIEERSFGGGQRFALRWLSFLPRGAVRCGPKPKSGVPVANSGPVAGRARNCRKCWPKTSGRPPIPPAEKLAGRSRRGSAPPGRSCEATPLPASEASRPFTC